MTHDLQKFFESMQANLLACARDKRSLQVKKRLEEYRQLVECWLDVAPTDDTRTVSFSFYSSRLQFVGPLDIDMYEIVRACGPSQDGDSLVSIMSTMGSLIERCRQKRLLQRYYEFGQVLHYAALIGMESAELHPKIGSECDAQMHLMLARFACRRMLLSGEERNRDATFLEEKAFLSAALSICLAIIRSAIEEGRPKLAVYFFERLVEYRKYNRRGTAWGDRAAVTESVDTLHDYAVLTAGAWALHVIKSGEAKSHSAATQVFNAASKHLDEQEELVSLWELYHSDLTFEAEIDQRLRTDRWDLKDSQEIRIGVSTVRDRGGAWLTNGLFALLLRARESNERRITRFFAAAPRKYMWNPEQSSRVLVDLAATVPVDLPEAKRDAAVKAVIALLQARQRAADDEYAKYVASEPLDSARGDKMRERAAEAFRTSRIWSRTLRKLGADGNVPTTEYSPLVYRSFMAREYFVSKSVISGDVGSWIGESAAQREAMGIVYIAEQRAERGESVTALADIPEAVRRARRNLLSRGCQPNLVIVPPQHRFGLALFQVPLWQVEAREFGPIDLGLWEGLRVLRCPYTNSNAIVVMDVSKFVGTFSQYTDAIQVSMRESTPEEVGEWKRLVETTSGAAGRKDEPQLVIELRAAGEFGLRLPSHKGEQEAAIAIDIRSSDGGYALRRGENLYHKPLCEDIEGDDEVTYSLLRKLPEDKEDRQPCPKCNPS